MLVEAVNIGTGKRAKVSDWDIGGKTGTSQNARDAWFIGFTSSYVVGVWMGSDDNTPLKGVVGGNLPSIIWSEINRNIHLEKPNILPTLSAQQLKRTLSDGFSVKKPLDYDLNTKPEEKSIFKRILDYLKNNNL